MNQTMNQSTAPIPAPLPRARHHLLATLCVAALWFLIIVKGLWLSLSGPDLHFVSPMPLFCVAFAILLAATIAFQTGRLATALGLSWVGVILGYVAAHISGVVPGMMTNRVHEQMLYHWADNGYLIFAHLLFFIRRSSAV